MTKVLILEDENYTLRFLEKLISQHPLVSQVIATSSGREATALAGKYFPDIALLDIELAPEEWLNGIEVARTIQEISPQTKFVFITGYTSYAIESFTVHPYEYVLKPIRREKVMNLITELANNYEPNPCQATKDDKLLIRDGPSVVFVNFNDIFFVEKQAKKAFIHSRSGVWETTCSLNELETLLIGPFIRVHKSFLVNMDKIARVTDIGSQSFTIFFNNYEKTALMSRNKYREHQSKFTPSL
ncbi:MAG: LytTR family DNA-binding domain-containing protein [Syntrophomonadaceae bacterium]|nr:LytTR family DNA-binding domain-containing protein [Syntrophomonadaceae bacterium]MDD4548411.1 LytTR family DNA-binding domain-containing protein [Syntrophomonadaceae bacterium]